MKLPMLRFALLFVAVASSTFAGSQASSNGALARELTAREQTIWKAFAAQDLATLRAIFTPDFTFVDADGVINADELMKDAAVCVERNWTFDHPRATALGKDSALLVLHVTQDSACNGKQQAAHIFVVTTWVRQRGQWRQKSHTELPAKS